MLNLYPFKAKSSNLVVVVSNNLVKISEVISSQEAGKVNNCQAG
jgi:hypothetical protein